MNIAVVIPARWGSTRFPGKALADIAGKPLLLRVVEQARKARQVDAVIVATDDQRIADAAAGWGVEVAMTREDHPSGTDRIAEAIADRDVDAVINVQGDEPLINPELIDQLAGVMREGRCGMATAVEKIVNEADLSNPGVVKVVCNVEGNALYFSRSAIPHYRDGSVADGLADGVYLRHLGIYAYTKGVLLKLVAEPPAPLERLEMLEQLRALHLGIPIHVVETEQTGPGVDTPEDAERVARMILENVK